MQALLDIWNEGSTLQWVGYAIRWALWLGTILCLVYAAAGGFICEELFQIGANESRRSGKRITRISRFLAVPTAIVLFVAAIVSGTNFWIVGQNQILLTKAESYAQGGYLNPGEPGEFVFRVPRELAFERLLKTQASSDAQSQLSILLICEYRVEDLTLTSKLYPVLWTHHSIEEYVDWKLRTLYQNPSALENLGAQVEALASELKACGFNFRIRVQEVTTKWSQFPAEDKEKNVDATPT